MAVLLRTIGQGSFFCSVPRRIHTSTAIFANSYNSGPASESTSSRSRVSSNLIKPKPSATPIRTLEETAIGSLRIGKIRDHLRDISRSRETITFADAEKHRPKAPPPPISDSTYENEYQTVLNDLLRSFNKVGLLKILEMYQIRATYSRTKQHYATLIMEHWNWPSLKDALKRREGRQMSKCTFSLTASQAFLILTGKAIILRELNEEGLMRSSQTKKVRLSLMVNPLQLEIEGPRGSLDEISHVIEVLKEDIENDFLVLPVRAEFTPATLEAISRFSKAFVESFDDGKVRISYLKTNLQSLFVAKELCMQALYENASLRTTTPLVYHPSDDSHIHPVAPAYSLYPFAPSQPTLHAVKDRSTFRIRQINDVSELGKAFHPFPEIMKSLSLVNMGQSTPTVLQQLLKNMFPPEMGSNIIVRAFPGHLLLDTPQRNYGIQPPRQDNPSIPEFIKWIERYPEYCPVFHPCVPAHTFHAKSTTNHASHRLIYGIPSKHTKPLDRYPNGSISHIITFEVVVRIPKSVLDPNVSDSGNVKSAQIVDAFCDAGWEGNVHVLLPDSSTDMRFTVSNLACLPSQQWPQELNKFLEEFRTFSSTLTDDHPKPPLTIWHQGQLYVLIANLEVRKSWKAFQNESLIGEGEQSSFDFIVETATEAGTKRTMTTCQIICDLCSSEGAWKRFITTCGWLSSASMDIPTELTS